LREIAAATPPVHPSLEMAPPSPVQTPEEIRTAQARIRSRLLKPTGPQPETAPAPAAKPPKIEVERLQLDSAPPLLTLNGSAAEGPRSIEEMLVCTNQNEVLYEWRCVHTDLRLRCLDVLRHKAQQANRRLALGTTSRFDFQSAQGRIIVRLQGDTTIFVRSTTAERPPATKVSPFNMPLTDWVSRHVNVNGLLACGIVREQLTLVSCSYSQTFPSESLNLGWRSLTELFELIQEQNFSPWQIRWLCESTQFHCVRRKDGLTLALLLTNDPALFDHASLQRVCYEFSALIQG
jgi:hypothetical protein